MTTKEKVLKVYPDAKVAGNANVRIVSLSAMKILSRWYASNEEEAAWQNAAESLPAQPEQDDLYAYSFTDSGEHAPSPVGGGCIYCEGRGRAYKMRPAEPVAPVENRLTYEETTERFGLPIAEPKPTPSTDIGCEGCGEPVYLTRGYGYSHVDTTLNVSCDARPKSNHPSVPKPTPSIPDGYRSRSHRQRVVGNWCVEAFGEQEGTSLPQRGIRLLEEAAEAAQSAGVDLAMAEEMMRYVWSRPAGALFQEIGGVGVTTLALAQAALLEADECEAIEVERVLSKPLEHFTKRNQVKNDAGFLAKPQPDSSSIPDETDPCKMTDAQYEEYIYGPNRAEWPTNQTAAPPDSSSISSEPMPEQLVSEEELSAAAEWQTAAVSARSTWIVRRLAEELQQWRKWAAAKGSK